MPMTKLRVVNLFAGPGVGKSSTAAGIFYFLKWDKVNAEMALEYAKDIVWREEWQKLGNQAYIFGKQYERLKRVENKVDVVITDSPLLLGLIYGKKEPESFRNYVRDKWDEFYNMNFFLTRTKPYHRAGRVQDEDEAKAIDDRVRNMLTLNGITYKVSPGDKNAAVEISKYIKESLDARDC